MHLKGENWKNKDNKGSTILVRLKGYNAQTGAETIFKQENPASQQSPADGKAADPEVYWKIDAKEDGTFEEDYDLPKNLIPGQGLKLEFETGAAANDIKRNKTTESLVIGGTEYVEKQAASARAVPRAMAAEAAAKAAEIESTAKEAAESAKAEASATGSAVANAMAPQTPGGSAEPTDSDKATAPTTPSATPSTQSSAPSTTQTSPSTTPSTSGTASSKTSTPPNNSGTSQSTTASTQPPKDDKKQNDSSCLLYTSPSPRDRG